MSQFGLKVRFAGDVRRITLDSNVAFADLLQTLSKLLSQPAQDLVIRYTDNEGDNVLVRLQHILPSFLLQQCFPANFFPFDSL